MPIPSPTKGEKTDDFLPRCIKAIANEYPTEQAYAICQKKVENRDMSKEKIEEEIFVLSPRKSENRGSYISRCSAHSKMRGQFPGMKERMGACLNAFNAYYKYWSRLEDFGEKDTEGTALGDCIAKQKATGLDYKEAYARCASKVVVAPGPIVLEKEDNLIVEPVFGADDISIDFDDTANTDRGKELLQELIDSGKIIHIITRRQQAQSKQVYDLATEFGIPKDRVHFTNGKLKWELIKTLGIIKHIDNNPDEIKAIKENLPEVEAVKFCMEC